MYNSVSSNSSPSPFPLSQETREALHLPQRFMKVFLRFKSDELEKYKNENNSTLFLHPVKIFTILLISKNNEFAETHLEVRKHHPSLPVSEFSFGSSLKTLFFQLSSLSTGTRSVLSCRTTAAKMAGYL